MHAARPVDWRGNRLTVLFIAMVTVAVAVPGLYLVSAPRAAADDATTTPFEPATAKPTPLETKVEFLPPVGAIEAKIRATLDQMTTLQFDELPLSEVFEYIGTKHDIEVVADEKAIDEAGTRLDATVRIDIKNVRLRSALGLILRRYDLAYVIRDEVLLITTQEEAEQFLIVRTYPVGDLVPPLPLLPARAAEVVAPKPEAKPSAEASGETKSEIVVQAGGGGMGGMGGGMARVSVGRGLNPSSQYGALMNALTTTIAPESWDDSGGPGSVVAFQVSRSLVISQRQDVHDQVLDLLRSLRAAKLLEK